MVGLHGFIAARQDGLTRRTLARSLGYTIPLGSACFDEVWGHTRILCVPYRNWIVAVSGLAFMALDGEPVAQLAQALGRGSEATYLIADETTDTYLFTYQRDGCVRERICDHDNRLYALDGRLAVVRELPYHEADFPLSEQRFFEDTLGTTYERLVPRLMYAPAQVFALP